MARRRLTLGPMLDVPRAEPARGDVLSFPAPIAGVVADSLSADAIVPSPLDPRVAPAVATAVAAAATES